ncbi:MAG: TrmH family RNA methyltransferase [Pseudomonadota bacterium]
MRLALLEPEIAANLGAAIRVAACFGADLDVIEPCGFPMSDRRLKRAALDYGALASPILHHDWDAFENERRSAGERIILLTTRADQDLWSAELRETDAFLIGRESSGAPEAVHAAADLRLRIPLAPRARSLNMAVAAAVALSEARRQVGFSRT